MGKILDQTGQPIDRQVLDAPQTSSLAYLRNQWLQPMLGGLTPARLAAVLQQADQGLLTAQHRLFADMEDRDAHLRAEIDKRKLAVQTLDWDIVPPRQASTAEKASGEWVKEVLGDAVDPLEDLILAMMEGPGHGFAAVELEWRREGATWLPAFHPRPQEWFQLDGERRSLRLIDQSRDGAALLPFGWVFHTHGKAKTGYLGRLGLYRPLVWPFLYKNYGVGDLAEFLETYGLPIIVGKYFSGASEAEKASLLAAVTDLGHDARAIMPQDMLLEIQKITGSGDAAPHLALVDWCERSQSKAILGQVLSAEAKATGLGSGLAHVHNEVRHDIRDADARQIAGTLTRDLIYPLIALNRAGVDSLARCPRLVFDTGEAEDIKTLAEALPSLVALKMQIPVAWAHEKLKIPLADGAEPVLEMARPELAVPPALRGQRAEDRGQRTEDGRRKDLRAEGAEENLSSVLSSPSSVLSPLSSVLWQEEAGQLALNAALATLPGADIEAAMQALLAPAIAALQAGDTPDEAGDALLAAFPQLDSSALETLLARAIFVSDVWGRLSAGRDTNDA